MNINSPEDIKKMNIDELNNLSKEIREFLVDNISKTGGHLASNLGVVELTVALHYVFDSPNDKLIFDVGHQSYTHKILTGRAEKFSTLRQYAGLSGYQKRSESPHDAMEGGHTSTSIGQAMGMALARDLNGDKYDVISVIGDGAMGGGLAFEALNHISSLKSKVIIILNDNEYSISPNLGGLNEFLTNVRTSVSYNKTKQEYKEFMQKYVVTNGIYKFTKAIKNKFKNRVFDNIFTDLNIEYLGPVDGHDYKDLIRALNKAKNFERSILVHVVTKKGKGYAPAEIDSSKWHGVAKFEISSGKLEGNKTDKISFSEVISKTVYELMEKDNDIVTITPAMINGSKLEKIFSDFPDRSVDTGITEGYASLLAHGLAINGKKPFLSIYSTFLQRAYDELNHDIGRMKSHVVIGIDRAGLVGEDGETHHGVFDISFIRSIPNAVICSPKDSVEARNMLYTGFYKQDNPFFIRYGRESLIYSDADFEEIKVGTWEYLQKKKNSKGVIISYGTKVVKLLELYKEKDVDIINARYIKPLDTDMLGKINKKIFVYETDMLSGALGSAILEYLSSRNKKLDVKITGIGDHFVTHGKIDELLLEENLDIDYIVKEINTYFNI